MINGRGEILLWGKASNLQDQERLSTLRWLLQSKAKLDGRDTGYEIHITLGTIDNFIALTQKEKMDIAKKLSKYWQSTQHQHYLVKSGTTHIDRVKLVDYAHRSLSKWSEEFELKLMVG